MIRTIVFAVLMFLYFIMSFIYLLPKVLWAERKGKGSKLARKYSRGWGKFFFDITGSKAEVIYKDKEDYEKVKDETLVIISNHLSYIDILLLLGYFPKEVGLVAKKEMEKWPFISTWMEKIQCVFLDRTDPRKGIESMREATKRIKNGLSIVIFPEGTRSTTGEIGEFKKGSFKLAIDSGVKILPMTIIGTHEILNKQKKMVVKNTNVKLVIGKAIDINEMSKEDLKNINNIVRDVIVENFNHKWN